MSFGTVIFLYPGSQFMEKESNNRRKVFSISGNASLSIILKYQEMNVQIQTFADKDIETSCIVDLLRLRVRIEVRPIENDLTRLYKNGDISVVITCS